MQNILIHWERVVERGEYPVPYSAEAELSIVDLRDVAAAAATVLVEEGHEGAIYELSGPEALSQEKVAAVLGHQLGREVRVEVVPIDAWEEQVRASGMGGVQIETLRKMFEYYDRYGLKGNPRVLGWLLGRPPTTFADFVRRHVERAGLEV
jgi:uncharacterized protein YbjT (DUF2867 family)